MPHALEPKDPLFTIGQLDNDIVAVMRLPITNHVPYGA